MTLPMRPQTDRLARGHVHRGVWRPIDAVSDTTDHEKNRGEMREGAEGARVDGRVSFGLFTFDERTGELEREGRAIKLAPTPGRVLTRLLSEPGRVVAREDLERDVWGRLSTDGGRSLNFAIREIRSALGDDAASPRYVETLQKRGYRFIAPVAGSEYRSDRVASSRDRRRDAPGVLRTVGAVTLLAMALGALALLRPVLPSTGAHGGRPLLVVLPLEHLTDDARFDFLASGLGDELLTALARLPPEEIGIIGRASARRYAGDERPIQEIATELDATHVLAGSMTPRGDEVRVALQLLDARDGTLLWAESFVEPYPVTLALERAVAEQVAAKLAIQIGGAEGRSVPDVELTPVAREAYLKGVYLLRMGRNSRLREAVATLRTAVDLAPRHSSSREALGIALARLGERDESLTHLEMAIGLDERATEARVALARDALFEAWDPERSGVHLEYAVQHDGGSALGHQAYAEYLSLVGEHDDAIREIRTAFELDPVSPLVTGDVGRIYYRAGLLDRAAEFCIRSLELVPDSGTARLCLINIAMLRDEPEAARAHALALMRSAAAPPDLIDRVQRDRPRAAVQAFWRWRLAALEADAAEGLDRWVPLAQVRLWLGQPDLAMKALEGALAARSSILPLVSGDPCFASLHGLARFGEIVAATGLPRLDPPRLG